MTETTKAQKTAREKKEKGARAEQMAVDFLLERGFVVVGRNVRLGRQEIDIIAWENDVLCFVEVRARRGQGYFSAKASVGLGKQKNVIKAAQKYLEELEGPPPFCRFDVVAVELGHPELIRNAFEASS
ncbi:MAG: YraN family protein [Deltaproteobacteria bacterium]|nr:YraN family protein [Deltaproteobacteria bacterium]